GWVEARTGLAAGDLLVVRGAESLTPNAKVKPRTIDPADLATGSEPAPRGARPGASGSASAGPGAPPAPGGSASAAPGARERPPTAGSPGAPPAPPPPRGAAPGAAP